MKSASDFSIISLEPSRFPTLSSQRKWPPFAPRLRAWIRQSSGHFPSLIRERRPRFITTKEGKVVYKLFRVQDGKAGAFVPGQMRMGGDGQIRIAAGPPPTFQEFLGRMARTNGAGDLTPTEFIAVTPDGYAVFGQPFVTGRSVSEKNTLFALERVGLSVITQMGGTAALGRVNGKLVLFDDLHGRNVKIAPNGRVRGYRRNQPGTDA